MWSWQVGPPSHVPGPAGKPSLGFGHFKFTAAVMTAPSTPSSGAFRATLLMCRLSHKPTTGASGKCLLTGIVVLETSAEQAARNDDLQLPHLVLTIDAMDKSKWQVPRQLDNTKKLGALWRPCLHLVGVLVAGVLEYFAVLEADVKGGSDCQQTLLSRALELAEEELRSRGKSMPTRLVFHSDNTSKEGRNSMLLQFAAVLVGTQRAEEVTIAMVLIYLANPHGTIW